MTDLFTICTLLYPDRSRLNVFSSAYRLCVLKRFQQCLKVLSIAQIFLKNRFANYPSANLPGGQMAMPYRELHLDEFAGLSPSPKFITKLVLRQYWNWANIGLNLHYFSPVLFLMRPDEVV